MYIHKKRFDWCKLSYTLTDVRQDIVRWFKRRYRITHSMWPVIHYLQSNDTRLLTYLIHKYPDFFNPYDTYDSVFGFVFADMYIPGLLAIVKDNIKIQHICDDISHLLASKEAYEETLYQDCFVFFNTFLMGYTDSVSILSQYEQYQQQNEKDALDKIFDSDGIICTIPDFLWNDERIHRLILSNIDQLKSPMRHFLLHKIKNVLINTEIKIPWKWYLFSRQRDIFALDYAIARSPYRERIKFFYQDEPITLHTLIHAFQTGELTWADTMEGEEYTML